LGNRAIFITTTAGRQDNRDGRFAYGIYSDAARWADNFYDAKNREEVIQMVKANRRDASRMVIVQGTFSHTQVGVTDQTL
jgi:3-dehydroquinate dehydratase